MTRLLLPRAAVAALIGLAVGLPIGLVFRHSHPSLPIAFLLILGALLSFVGLNIAMGLWFDRRDRRRWL